MSEDISLDEFGIIPIRNPVIPSGSDVDWKRIDREWVSIAMRTRRSLQEGNLAVRDILLQTIDSPVAEDLPKTLIDALEQQDPTMANSVRTRKMLRDILHIAVVPPEQQLPDLENALRLEAPQEHFDYLQEAFPQSFRERMSADIAANKFEKGISKEEFVLIRHRIQYARDVKLLSLAAMLLSDQPVFNAEGVMTSHGIQIQVDPGKKDAHSSLLDPNSWLKAVRYKARIARIETKDGNQYILKEKRTPSHYEHTHKFSGENVSSPEEYAIGKTMEKLGPQTFGNVTLDWEKPIGCVVFPDGYQFNIFEFEKNITDDKSVAMGRLKQVILSSLEESASHSLAEEFHAIQERTYSLLATKRFGAGFVQRLLGRTPRPSISPELFARIKAGYMMDRSKSLRDDLIDAAPFRDDDSMMGANAYRIGSDAHLTAIGLDYEYYRQRSPKPGRSRKFREKYKPEDQPYGAGDSGNLERAMYAAMYEHEQENRPSTPSESDPVSA
ncbi:hypothetical protein EXS70_01615 [Candidatus Peribacteria bacterium]|nr:hypothetical protein [Candidatus Peribacteria bacterium]